MYDLSDICDIYSCKILLVDDMDFNLSLLRQILTKNGFHNILVAKNGKEALDITIRCNPHLIVLDLIMPEMDGYEYCKKIRSHDRFKDMPIIVQTALTNVSQKIDAFAVGASDFIIKPIEMQELVARVKLHLERYFLVSELKNFKERLSEELFISRKMQTDLMPRKEYIETFYHRYGIKINSLFKTSSELGGDFWYVNAIDDNRFYFHITDFSGHGISSAINTFRMHILLQNMHLDNFDVCDAVYKLNDNFRNILSVGQYATMFLGMIDVSEDILYYVPAACPRCMVINPTTKKIELLEGQGFPIGVSALSTYEKKSVKFDKNSILFLYSDALIETEDKYGSVWSEDAIIYYIQHLLLEYNNLNGELLYNKILDNFTSHYANNVRDDLTINIYHRLK